jgi:hypothetical protein
MSLISRAAASDFLKNSEHDSNMYVHPLIVYASRFTWHTLVCNSEHRSSLYCRVLCMYILSTLIWVVKHLQITCVYSLHNKIIAAIIKYYWIIYHFIITCTVGSLHGLPSHLLVSVLNY